MLKNIKSITVNGVSYNELQVDTVDTMLTGKQTRVTVLNSNGNNSLELSATVAALHRNQFALKPQPYCEVVAKALVKQNVIKKSDCTDVHSGFNDYHVYDIISSVDNDSSIRFKNTIDIKKLLSLETPRKSEYLLEIIDLKQYIADLFNDCKLLDEDCDDCSKYRTDGCWSSYDPKAVLENIQQDSVLPRYGMLIQDTGMNPDTTLHPITKTNMEELVDEDYLDDYATDYLKEVSYIASDDKELMQVDRYDIQTAIPENNSKAILKDNIVMEEV